MSYPQYPPFMPYPSYFPSYNPYLIYTPQQYPQSSSTTMGTQNPIEGVTREQVPPPPPITPTVPTQETERSSPGKVKMINYLKLNAPKYKEGNDPFKYIRAVKMIVDELDTSNNKDIQMTSIILKCKKAKEWYKSYIADNVNSMT
ncbi:hypothetical protein P3X46_033773 [Hevea brasiliensis]|uniref:Uncharacterized protein n=1 Tax=Hevea brasiliensis TaxID=3981 RepID=A0ABQ9KB96_HEVBR|nr:hypothetical protein P3X46_033773 [Hevea brasiliensis]